MISKMETCYQKKDHVKEEYLQNLNLHIPQWAKNLIEFYTSPLKYEIKYGLRDSEEYEN